jgi:hypothetical protein
VQSLGAIIKRELQSGEDWIVDNGHLGTILRILVRLLLTLSAQLLGVLRIAWNVSLLRVVYSLPHIPAKERFVDSEAPEQFISRLGTPRTSDSGSQPKSPKSLHVVTSMVGSWT